MPDKHYKKTKIGDHALSPQTQMMSYGYDPKLSEGSIKPPIFLTSTFEFDTAEAGEEFFNVMSGRKESAQAQGLIYSRFNHPNVQIVEERMSLLEQSEDTAILSSGMGAISATMFGLLNPGDVILHSSPLYGGTETLIHGLMKNLQIRPESFQADAPLDAMLSAAKKAAAKGSIKMVFVETPANPTNAMVDFEHLIALADTIENDTGTRPILVCDNTLLGPIFQKAVPQGIDLAIYSLTKYVGGHSDLVAGAACGSCALIKRIKQTRSAVGLNLDPHTCWMLARSLETLDLRMNRAAISGKAVATWLNDQAPRVTRILHPDFIDDPAYQTLYKRQTTGPGSTFSFVLDADKNQTFAFLNELQIFKLAVSLGGNESLVCHPASTTHSGVPQEIRINSGVTDGLVRLSVGLEHPDDLIADIAQAMKAIA